MTHGLPLDTLIDDYPNLDGIAAAVIKAVYLAHPEAQLLRAQGMSDSEIIDAFETLRRAGFLRIFSDDTEVRVVISEDYNGS